jgi:antitoxin component YwqK of YwqJK toxin-antitoxin module
MTKTVQKPMRKKYIHRHKDRSMWAKGYLRGGKMDGYWEWFRKDGTKMRSGNFKKGKQAGKWTTYDRKGKVFKVTEMK